MVWRSVRGGNALLTLAWITCRRAVHAIRFCQTKNVAATAYCVPRTHYPIWPNINTVISQSCINLFESHSLNLNNWHAFHTSATVHANKNVDRSRVPVLNENDLEESFVRGSGPGGQSVNKTSSACHLKHIPTGMVVKCHEARSLFRNRAKARLLMINKLDQHFNGDMSVAEQMKRLQQEKSSKAQQKARKKQMMKQLWKEKEGLE